MMITRFYDQVKELVVPQTSYRAPFLGQKGPEERLAERMHSLEQEREKIRR